MRKVDPAFYSKYRDRHFGPQTMISLQLCSMLKREQASGYYHVDYEVFFGRFPHTVLIPWHSSAHPFDTMYFPSILPVPGDYQDSPDADVSSDSEGEVEPHGIQRKTFPVEFEKSLNWSFVSVAPPTCCDICNA